MNRMLSYEFYKLKKSKYWWICAIVLMAMTTLTVVGIYFGNKSLNTLEESQIVSQIITFALFKPAIVGQNSLLIAIICGILICSDFSDGTIKNVATKGIKRSEIVFSKIIVGICLGIFLITVKILTGLILGYILIGFSNVANAFWLDLAKTFALSILQTIAYISIFTLSGFLLKKPANSITMNIVLTIVVPIIIFITSSLIKYNDFKIGFDLNILIPNSLLLVQIDDTKQLLIYFSSMIFYILSSIILSLYIFNKKDIK